jgi:pyruvate-formate lyase-activating enzyme
MSKTTKNLSATKPEKSAGEIITASGGLQKRLFPQVVSMLPTYRCTAACENCCFDSNPQVKGQIPLDRILRYVDEAAALETVKLFVLSGGEAFLLGKNLEIIIEHATFLGLQTRIVTNGYWATSYENAAKRLSRLWAVGLRELNLSTGDYHEKFVPLERVIYGAKAAVDLGMQVVIMVESFDQSNISDESLKNHPLMQETLADEEKHSRLSILQSPWMTRGESRHGNNERHIKAGDNVAQAAENLVNRQNLSARRGCTSVLNTLTITPYERVGACCGLPREEIPELDIGSAREEGLEKCYETGRNDFLKMWLAIEGPEHILAWASEYDADIEWENLYGHQCDACRAVYQNPKVATVIKEHYRDKLPDVLLQFVALDKAEPEREIDKNSQFIQA